MKRQRLEGAAAATGRGLHRDAENPLPHKAPGSGNPLSDGRGDTGAAAEEQPGQLENIKVVVRVRPLSGREGGAACVQASSGSTVRVDKGSAAAARHEFAFDRVAGPEVGQEELFADAGLEAVQHCWAGYNVTIFAYGQTGSGKSHTMGMCQAEGGAADLKPGIIQLSFAELFRLLEEERAKAGGGTLEMKLSFLEIYNERIFDLLNPAAGTLKPLGGRVQGLTERAVKSVEDVERVLESGIGQRKVASTSMNDRSSRSHSVLTCTLERTSVRPDGTHSLCQSRFNLVDLAGSENQGKSKAEGKRQEEAANINKSLLVLGRVISALSRREAWVPYPDSILTCLLKDSLGGNSRTVLIATMSPALSNVSETLETLRFADSAKRIRNKATANVRCIADVAPLHREVERLRQELEAAQKGFGAAAEKAALEEQVAEKEAECAGLRLRVASLEGELDRQRAADAEALEALRELASDVREMMQVTHSQVEELGQSVKGAVEAHMAVRAAAHKEIQTAQQRAKDAQARLAEVQSEAAALQQQLQAVQADAARQAASGQQEVHALHLQLAAARDEQKSTATREAATQQEAPALQQQVQRLEQRLAEQARAADAQGSEAGELQRRLVAADEACRRLQAERDAAREDVAQQANAAQAEVCALRQQLTEQAQAAVVVGELQRRLAAADEACSRLQAEREAAQQAGIFQQEACALRRQLSEQAQATDTQAGELGELQRQLAAAEAGRDAAQRSIAALRQQLEEQAPRSPPAGVVSLGRELHAAREEAQSLRQQLAEATQRAAAAQRDLAAAEQEAQGLREQLAAAAAAGGPAVVAAAAACDGSWGPPTDGADSDREDEVIDLAASSEGEEGSAAAHPPPRARLPSAAAARAAADPPPAARPAARGSAAAGPAAAAATGAAAGGPARGGLAAAAMRSGWAREDLNYSHLRSAPIADHNHPMVRRTEPEKKKDVRRRKLLGQ